MIPIMPESREKLIDPAVSHVNSASNRVVSALQVSSPTFSSVVLDTGRTEYGGSKFVNGGSGSPSHAWL